MDLHLEEQEASLVMQVLKNRLEELRIEVRHNKDSEARQYLKRKESRLNNILNKFPVSESADYQKENSADH